MSATASDRAAPLPPLADTTGLAREDTLLAPRFYTTDFAELDRTDVSVRPTDAACAIDRTLATERPAVSAALWYAAGYAAPPTVAAMVTELAAARP